MKARTKSILAAGEDRALLGLDDGVCTAISGASYTGIVCAMHSAIWFTDWFAPDGPGINDRWVHWLGDFTAENLERRLTFIAMAAAVSETEP